MRRFEERIKADGGQIRSSAYNLTTNVEGMKAYRHQELERDYLSEIERTLRRSGLGAQEAVEALDDYAVARYHDERKRLIRIKKDGAQRSVDEIYSDQRVADERLEAKMEAMTEQRASLVSERDSGLFAEGRTKEGVEREIGNLKLERARTRDRARRAGKARTKLVEKAKRELAKFPADSAWAPDSTAITGISDFESRKVIDEAPDAIREAHSTLVAMNGWTRDLMVAHGHVTAAWAEWMRLNQPNYVPLRDTDADMDFNYVSRQGGFNTPGPETEPAFGRNTRAANSFFFSAVQAQSVITRTANGEVGRAFLEILEDNPGMREWREIDPPMNGEGYRVEPGTNVFEVKRNGESIWIEIQDERLASVLKGMEAEPLGKALAFSGTVTRFVAQMSTSRNPAFIIPNILRDGIQAAIAVGERADVNSKDVVKNWIPAAKSMARVIDGGVVETEMDGYAQEFAEAGGMTGHSMQQDYEQLGKQIVKRIGRGPLASALGPGGSWWQAFDSMNSVAENATRLSVFVAMRRNGTSIEEATAYARDMTVNFARKGELGTTMNALFMFSNVGIQGAHAVIRTMKSPKVRRRLAGLVAGSILIDALNRAWAGEDEDGRNVYDAIPRYERERNLILFLPGGREPWIKVPLPYGFNIFWVIGQSLGAAGAGVRSNGDIAGDLVAAATGSFNPLGNDPTVSVLQFAAPTVLDPVVQIAENKNWFGAPIAPGGGSYDKRPDSQRFNRSVSQPARALTTLLNGWTGGDETASGWLDVSPETLEHWYEFAGGGAAKFAERVWNSGLSLATEGSAPINDTPILRRFIGTVDGRRSRTYYYDNRESVQTMASRVRAHTREGRRGRANDLRKNYGWQLRLEDSLKAAEKRRKSVVDQKLGADDAQLKELEKQELAIMQSWNRLYTKAIKASDV